MEIHLWIFIVYGYRLRNVLARISVLGYQCTYPRLYGQLKTVFQKSTDINMDIHDFWKSMHGFAMDSRGLGKSNLMQPLKFTVFPIRKIYNKKGINCLKILF